MQNSDPSVFAFLLMLFGFKKKPKKRDVLDLGLSIMSARPPSTDDGRDVVWHAGKWVPKTQALAYYPKGALWWDGHELARMSPARDWYERFHPPRAEELKSLGWNDKHCYVYFDLNPYDNYCRIAKNLSDIPNDAVFFIKGYTVAFGIRGKSVDQFVGSPQKLQSQLNTLWKGVCQ